MEGSAVIEATGKVEPATMVGSRVASGAASGAAAAVAAAGV